MHVELINGLLGAGKTTFLLKLLEQKKGTEKVAVLVNEFGEIGIDGELVSGQGADVVELPNGCICCTLKSDLRNQIRMIAEDYNPDRLIIEPTGVATIKNLTGILGSLSLEKYIERALIYVVIDAGMFQEILAQNRGFVETQLEMAQVIILNKCDKVSSQEINEILKTIRLVNASCQVVPAVFGRALGEAKDMDAGMPGQFQPGFAAGTGAAAEHDVECGDYHGQGETRDGRHGQGRGIDAPLKDFQQFSASTDRTCDPVKLRLFFAALLRGNYGPVDRAKGVFRVSGDQWMRIDLAAHETREEFITKVFAQSKIIVIGTGLPKDELKKGFDNCLI